MRYDGYRKYVIAMLRESEFLDVDEEHLKNKGIFVHSHKLQNYRKKYDHNEVSDITI